MSEWLQSSRCSGRSSVMATQLQRGRHFSLTTSCFPLSSSLVCKSMQQGPVKIQQLNLLTAVLWRRRVEVWNRVGEELLPRVFFCMSSSKEEGGKKIKIGEDVTLNSTAYKCHSVLTNMEKHLVKWTREKEWGVTSGGHDCTPTTSSTWSVISLNENDNSHFDYLRKTIIITCAWLIILSVCV